MSAAWPCDSNGLCTDDCRGLACTPVSNIVTLRWPRSAVVVRCDNVSERSGKSDQWTSKLNE